MQPRIQDSLTKTAAATSRRSTPMWRFCWDCQLLMIFCEVGSCPGASSTAGLSEFGCNQNAQWGSSTINGTEWCDWSTSDIVIHALFFVHAIDSVINDFWPPPMRKWIHFHCIAQKTWAANSKWIFFSSSSCQLLPTHLWSFLVEANAFLFSIFALFWPDQKAAFICLSAATAASWVTFVRVPPHHKQWLSRAAHWNWFQGGWFGNRGQCPLFSFNCASFFASLRQTQHMLFNICDNFVCWDGFPIPKSNDNHTELLSLRKWIEMLWNPTTAVSTLVGVSKEPKSLQLWFVSWISFARVEPCFQKHSCSTPLCEVVRVWWKCFCD